LLTTDRSGPQPARACGRRTVRWSAVPDLPPHDPTTVAVARVPGAGSYGILSDGTS